MKHSKIPGLFSAMFFLTAALPAKAAEAEVAHCKSESYELSVTKTKKGYSPVLTMPMTRDRLLEMFEAKGIKLDEDMIKLMLSQPPQIIHFGSSESYKTMTPDNSVLKNGFILEGNDETMKFVLDPQTNKIKISVSLHKQTRTTTENRSSSTTFGALERCSCELLN